MLKKIALGVVVLLTGYLCLWPVPVDPVAWQAPKNPGYTGEFAQNQQLSQVNRIELTNSVGPEDLDKDAKGNVYFSLLNGDIDFIDPQGNIQTWVNTGGRPLGIEFDQQGNLIVADAFRGLISISQDKTITVLVDEINGQPLNYADDVDIADNGKIYFSDASSKFVAKDHGTYGASLLDMMEHGGHGSIIEYDPATKQTSVIAQGYNFANGVAVSHDQQWVLFNETGNYRVLKVGLNGEQRGTVEVVIDELPGFPDNIAQGSNGVYWLGLVSPRSKPLDMFSDSPFIRKMMQRLPAFIRPQAQSFGHIVGINDQGEVVHNLQDPLGMYGLTTGALEVDNKLYISSLHETALAVTSNVNVSEKQMVETQIVE